MSVELQNISKSIHGITVLSNISIVFHEGTITGLKGINGSGKTMLMRIIAGLIRPSSGMVRIGEGYLWKDISFPKEIGILIENPAFLPYLTGMDNLKLLAEIKNKISKEEISSTISKVGLDINDKRKYHQYSLGMKQRLGIAAAVMEHPKILLLDEPTNALDTDGIERLKALLHEEKNRGSIIVLSCHDYGILQELSDEIYMIEKGHIVGHEKIVKPLI